MEKVTNEVEESEQEILTPAEPVDSGTLAILQKSEINEQISVAKRYPRRITEVVNMATQLATADAETADEMIYALPRGGKTIEGPSVRFSEVLAYSWTNCRCGARVISEDQEFVVAQGSFFDMQMNVHVGYEVRRRITDKNGNRYNSDMIGMTSNAACSIALRNAILRGIPKAIWKKVYDQARRAVAGDIKTLDTRRAAAMKQFQLMGAKPEQIFALLDVKGIDDITLDHLVVLRGIFNAIREGETTVARAFAPPETQDAKLADKSKANLDKIKDKYAQQEKNGASQPPADTPASMAAAAETPVSGTAAPPNQQPVEVGPPREVQTAAKPEGGSGEPSSAPQLELQPESEDKHPGPPADQHGVPNIFGIEEAKTKRKR